MIHQKNFIVASTLTLVIFVSGCSRVATESQAEPHILVSAERMTPESISLPLDAFIHDARGRAIITHATSLVATQCLARFGFKVVPPPLVEARPGHAGRYGITDIEEARAFGYHPAPRQTRDQRREPELPQDAYAVMHGEISHTDAGEVPKGGCLGEARGKLGSLPPEAQALPYALSNEAAARAENDSRLLAAFADWSTCMQRQGHEYADPWTANDDPLWQQSTVATALEKKVAVADVSCKDEIDLITIWAAVETAYQLQAIEANETALAGLKERASAELKTATFVWMSGGL